MAPDDDTRNFFLREADGTESSKYTGKMPRQAAKKAARDLEPAETEADAEADPTEIRLRETGTSKLHVYDAWAWKGDPPDFDPDEWDDDDPWIKNVDSVTKGNVRKKGIEHLDE